jgi:aminocarboxymuconate-semialdehyde decarboxylase
VDCITHDTQALEYIIDKVGSEKVCLGSDYPFPLGDLEIGKFIEGMNLPENQLSDIYADSALSWLALDKKQYC